MTTFVSPAQAAQRANRHANGRFAEGLLADAGNIGLEQQGGAAAFSATYRPMRNEHGSIVWTADQVDAVPERQLWSLVYDEAGRLGVENGFRSSDVAGYMVTEQTWDDWQIRIETPLPHAVTA